MYRIAELSAREVLDLRRKILRPHQTPEEATFALDDHPLTVHPGAFLDERLVGVASLLPETPDGEIQSHVWRIRGMAVEADQRGRGCGRLLLDACLHAARQCGGRRVWCNARTTAAGFYERHGFRTEGDPFELSGIGPHFRMIIDL